jgi:hypothetical protein
MRNPRRRCDGHARPLLTLLEDRTVPTAGLSVNFSGGILRVTDYRAADTIAVHQTASGVVLDAAGDHQVYSAVARVLLDVQSDARVTNDVAGLNGAKAREVYLSRRDASGARFQFTGDLAPGTTSGPASPPPTPTPPPVPPPTPTTKTDWFDVGMSDASLRTVARSLAGDGMLDRSDWLRLFAQVEADGTVSTAEDRDLDNLLHSSRVTTSLTVGFTLPAAVQNLAAKVVDGNAANAHYQGGSLGNLQAGGSASQLQKLVAKWFLGSDHPTAANGTTYRIVGGALFVNGVSYADVAQGAVGDCYFVAALAGIARFSPQSIQQMFTDNGDGTFTVRFFNNGVADYVTVDRALAIGSSGKAQYASVGGQYGSSGNELWVALAEKAYAQINEEGWLGHAASNSYAAIDGGYSDLAIEHVTGANAGWKWMQNANWPDLTNAAARGLYTVLASKSGTPGNGVIADHGYALVGFNAATSKFTLYNPWGSTIELNWAQIQQSFTGFWQLGL